jgi:phosphoglycerate kinase
VVFGEEAKGDEAERFAVQLAGLADIYVNDAFGSWQAHASTVRVAKNLPAYAGFLLQKEIENLKRIYEPGRPFIAVVAGAKFDTKIDPMFALLEKADYLVMGGVIYNAYLCAKYGIEIKGVEQDDLESARRFVDFAAAHPGKLVELPFIVESDTMEGKVEGKYRVHRVSDIKPGTKLNYVLDVAHQSFEEPGVKDIFMKADTIFVNAVMGYTPHLMKARSPSTSSSTRTAKRPSSTAAATPCRNSNACCPASTSWRSTTRNITSSPAAARCSTPLRKARRLGWSR